MAYTPDNLAEAIWEFLDRNPGSAELDELVAIMREGLDDEEIDRARCHKAFELLRDLKQVDKGRAFITVRMGSRTIYALAQRPQQVVDYQLRSAAADVTRAKRREKNAVAALQQFPDDLDARRMARLRSRALRDANDVHAELKEMLNGR